ncbi:MAG TPA: flagellar hook-associated protein FlgK [Gammaproteobacteria bacterium]|nr:flagellar hook-associated protein FlgK [Gammaproteobacteria bacterium]
MTSILDTSLSGLIAYQGALATTSQNIANVGNEDYSRQRVELNARLPIRRGPSFIGQGVQLTDVARVIDNFNTISLRDSTSGTSRLQTSDFYATRIEGVLADERGSLQPALDAFFNALNDVANDPSAKAPRVALLGASENLEQRFVSLGTELQSIESEIDSRLRVEVAEVNAIATELAQLNGRISSISSVNNRPADLLDQRDALLKQLSEKISVNVVEQVDGTQNVLVGTGQLLVSNETSFTLVTQQDAAQPDLTAVAIQSNGSSVVITDSLVGGDLGGLLDVRTNLLRSAQNQLGRTAIAVSESINAQQVQGYDLNGNFGTNYFNTVSTGRLQGQFGGDYLGNGLAVGETIGFDLSFDGRVVSTSYTVQAGDTNQDVANGLLFGAGGIDADANVTDNGDGTYTLAGTTPGVSLTFELYGSNIKFESAGGPAPSGNNLTINNLTDGATDNTTLELLPLGPSSTTTTAAVVSTGSPATFVGPSTVAIPNQNNTGTDVVNYSITDINALTTSDYEVRFDGANYNVIRLSDNQTLASGAGPFIVDGLEITPGTGVPALGDSFYISATKLGAVNFQTEVNNPANIAGAAPIRAGVNAGNIGDISVGQLSITDSQDGDLTRTVDVFFDPANPAGTFDVVDQASGTVLQNDVVYFDGIVVNQNGWQLQLSGQPQPNDSVTVQNNTNAAGDNTNMLLLASIQTQNVLDNGNSTLEQSYNTLVTGAGVVTRQIKISLEVEESILRQAEERRESVSGVNLDEEAADLIRFQQAYQASARVIQASQEIFNALLSAV